MGNSSNNTWSTSTAGKQELNVHSHVKLLAPHNLHDLRAPSRWTSLLNIHSCGTLWRKGKSDILHQNFQFTTQPMIQSTGSLHLSILALLYVEVLPHLLIEQFLALLSFAECLLQSHLGSLSVHLYVRSSHQSQLRMAQIHNLHNLNNDTLPWSGIQEDQVVVHLHILHKNPS